MPASLDIGSYTAAISGIAVVLALDVLAVGARFYARRALRHKLDLNDWLVIPALVLVIGMAAAIFVGVEKDFLFSRNVTQLPGPVLRGKIQQAYSTIKKIETAVLLMSVAALALIKISFLVFYKQVLVYDKWRFFDVRNVTMNFMIFIVLAWGLGFGFTLIFECRGHFSAHWNTTTSEELAAKCVNTFLLNYALCITDVVTDGIILLIPIPLVWRLHLPLRQKLGVLIVFLLGSLAILASLIRLIWIRKIISVGTTPSAHHDPLTLISNELFWYVIESEIALLAVCLPSLSTLRRTQSINSVIRKVQSRLYLGSGRSTSGAIEKQAEQQRWPQVSHADSPESKRLNGELEHVGVLPDVESSPPASR